MKNFRINFSEEKISNISQEIFKFAFSKMSKQGDISS